MNESSDGPSNDRFQIDLENQQDYDPTAEEATVTSVQELHERIV